MDTALPSRINADERPAPGTFARDGSAIALVDFDHTLLAANSTELFISYCTPSLLIAVIDFLIRRAFPWRLTGIPRWFRVRDYLCVMAIVCLTPWNLLLWRWRAPRHFAALESQVVKAMLDGIAPGRIVVISFGIRFIIRAMLRGSHLAGARVLATPRLPSPLWFWRGKARIARDELGAEAVSNALFLTDSEDDRDLLDACADGRRIEPQGVFRYARERLYMPLRYSGSVKFTRSFAIDQWLLVDSCLYALCAQHGVVSLLHFLLIAPLLSLSFMAVYEIGYFENDMKAAAKEDKPTLSGKEARYRHLPIKWQSWIWAAGLGWAGLALAVRLGELPADALNDALTKWASLLLLSRIAFFCYNRLAPPQRLLSYPVLQFGKYGSILMLFSPSIIGSLLAIAQITTMWVNHIASPLGGNSSRFPKEEFRMIVFLGSAALVRSTGIFAGAAQAHSGPLAVEKFTFGAICLWLILRVAKAAVMPHRQAH